MKPVMQTNLKRSSGNCLAACFASILEVEIDQLPDLKCGNIMGEMEAYLNRRNMSHVWLARVDLSKTYSGYPDIDCILIGRSPRSAEISHAVVGRPNGYGWKMVHDPYPGGSGLDGLPESLIFLCTLCPTVSPY